MQHERSSGFHAFRFWQKIIADLNEFGAWCGVKEGRKGVDREGLDPD
jgi:hypothetical protein